VSLPPRRRHLAAVPLLCLALLATGCATSSIAAARPKRTEQFRDHLATYTEPSKTPEQAARTAALRDKLLHDEWVERGYRFGNEKGGYALQSASGMGFLGGTGYILFGLPGQWIDFTFGGDRPARDVALMEDPKSPDARRRGINSLLRWDFAQNGPYLRRYRQLARGDPDPTVRSVAIRALNRSRDAESRPLFIDALSDADDRVRLEAAKALVNLPDPAAADPLVKLVSNADEDRDVRIAAAQALDRYKKLEVARALTSRLGEKDFSVAWQARRSLRRLTGKDFHYNEAAWLEYISGPQKPFG